MQDNSAKYAIRYLICTLFVCLSIIGCSYFYKLSKGEKVSNVVQYYNDGKIDYKVYLKENKFFDDKVLTKENIEKDKKILISSLIDKIDIVYSYVMNFDDYVGGTYSYYIKAIIESNEGASNKNYWSKEYVLTEKQQVDVKSTKAIAFDAKTSVGYDEYNGILNEWKELANVAMDCILKVDLVFESNIKPEKLDNKYKIDDKLELTLPLSKSSTEITIKNNVDNDSKKIVETSKNEDAKFVVYRALFVCFFISSLMFILLIVMVRNNQVKANRYKIELKRILSTYDGIIVNVSSIPDLSKFNVIKVKSFDELLDAHSEVRMPINYLRQKHKSTFILVNDTMLWIYELRNKDE